MYSFEKKTVKGSICFIIFSENARIFFQGEALIAYEVTMERTTERERKKRAGFLLQPLLLFSNWIKNDHLKDVG